MTMTAEQLLDKAAQCERCHLVHEERLVRSHPVRPDLVITTAAEDGHPYSPLLDRKMIARLRELIPAGGHAEPAHEPGPAPEAVAAPEIAGTPAPDHAAAAEPEPEKPAARRTRTPGTKTAAGG